MVSCERSFVSSNHNHNTTSTNNKNNETTKTTAATTTTIIKFALHMSHLNFFLSSQQLKRSLLSISSVSLEIPFANGNNSNTNSNNNSDSSSNITSSNGNSNNSGITVLQSPPANALTPLFIGDHVLLYGLVQNLPKWEGGTNLGILVFSFKLLLCLLRFSLLLLLWLLLLTFFEISDFVTVHYHQNNQEYFTKIPVRIVESRDKMIHKLTARSIIR